MKNQFQLYHCYHTCNSFCLKTISSDNNGKGKTPNCSLQDQHQTRKQTTKATTTLYTEQNQTLQSKKETCSVEILVHDCLLQDADENTLYDYVHTYSCKNRKQK